MGGPFSLDHRLAIFQEIVDNRFIQCGANKYHKPVIGVINQLSFQLPGGPTLYDSMSVCVCQSPTFQGEQEHSSTSLVVNMPVSADSKPAPMPIGIS